MSMVSNKRAKVFISHSSEDSSVANALCELLEERGIACWIAPRDVPPGAHFAEEVLSAIEQTHATVVLLSEHSNSSTYVRNEVERAVSKGKPVLPVRIRNVLPSRSLELYLSASQWVDAWTPPLVQRADQIVAALRTLIPHYAGVHGLYAARIGVMALGGGAIRAIESLHGTNLNGLRLIAAHTYQPTLEDARFPVKIQLGERLVSGRNAGGDSAIGAAAAQEAKEQIRVELGTLELVIVVACLGGGTGTGASPLICSIARELGILSVAVVTIPFPMEGTRRARVATEGVRSIAACADSAIVILNQGLLEREVPIQQAFSTSNHAVVCAVRAISDLILKPGLVNVDFADVRQAVLNAGIGRVGIGSGRGEDAALVAANASIKSPLLATGDLGRARSLLMNIRAGSSMSLFSVNQAATLISNEVSEDAIVVFGAAVDESLEDDSFEVTLIALGLDAN